MSSSADLDGLASAELNVMKKRVEDFQTMATIQSALQEDITKINQLCFKICVTSAPTAQLSKPERKCVSQCAARFFDTRNLIGQHFMKTQQQE